MNAHALDERLFYRDPWLSEAEATIVAIDGNGSIEHGQVRVLLDATIFTPKVAASLPIVALSGGRTSSMYRRSRDRSGIL